MTSFFIGNDYFTGTKTFAGLDQKQKKPEQWGYFDLESGEIIVAPIYDYAALFDLAYGGGLALIKKDWKCGFLDPQCNIIVEMVWDEVRDGGFSEGRCAVRKGDKWGYIDLKGKLIVDPIFDDAESFNRAYEPYRFKGSLVAQFKMDGKWGWINEAGLIVIETIYEDIQKFIGICDHAENKYFVARVKMDGKYGFINGEGSLIIQPEFEEAFEFWDIGYAAVKNNGQWSLVDRKGVNVAGLQFEDIGHYYGTLGHSMALRRWGTNKEHCSSPMLGSTELSRVYFTVKSKGQWGIMDYDFKVLLPELKNRFVIFNGSKIYIKDGSVTSTRKIKVEKNNK